MMERWRKRRKARKGLLTARIADGLALCVSSPQRGGLRTAVGTDRQAERAIIAIASVIAIAAAVDL